MSDKPKKGMGYIYKYTSPSGKSYVGQTVQSLENRAGHNGKNYLGCKYFYAAIKKYGWENFTVEILGQFPIEQLNYQERRFMEIFNTLVPNGYNIQSSERNYHTGRKIVYQYNKDGQLLRSYNGPKEAAEEIGVTIQSMSSCLNGGIKTCGGFYWSYQALEKYPVKEILSNKEKEVSMYDLNGNFIRTFKSIGEAANFVKGERSPIRKCCRNELKTAYGYKWYCPEVFQEKKYSNNKPTAIEQLDINSLQVIQTFPSISAAARALNKSGTSLIRRALENQAYSAYGYKWRKAQSSTTNDS